MKHCPMSMLPGIECRSPAVADPGFPIGGHGPVGVDGPPVWVLFSKMHVKTKELGPVGVCVPGTPPRSASDLPSSVVC